MRPNDRRMHIGPRMIILKPARVRSRAVWYFAETNHAKPA